MLFDFPDIIEGTLNLELYRIIRT